MATNTVYLKVILVLINRIYEEEILLNSRSQIISISRDMAVISKII